MGQSVTNTKWMLTSEYDNKGVRLMMKDADDAKRRMVEGMTAVSPTLQKTNPMAAMMASTNQEMAKQFDTIDKLKQARVLNSDLVAKREHQNAMAKLQDEKTLMAMEETRRQRNIDMLLREDSLTNNKKGGIGAIGSKGAMAMQQVGFAVQDFSSQYETRGLAGGIGAVSNNVAMLGAALGPVGLAVTSIGAGIGGVILPPLAKWLDGSKAIEEKTKSIESNYERLKGTMSGLKDVAGFGPGLTSGGDAQKKITELTSARTALAREQFAIQKAIREEMKGGNDEGIIGALRKQLTSVTEEYSQTDDRLKAITKNWTPSRLLAELRRDEHKKVLDENSKAADVERERLNQEETDRRKAGFALIKGMGDSNIEKFGSEADKMKLKHQKELADFNEKTAGMGSAASAAQQDLLAGHEFERQKLDANERLQSAMEQRNKLAEDIRSPNGPSAANIRGTAAATSSINRAIAGTRSVEGDKKSELKKQDQIIKELQDMNKKLSFKKAGLGA